MSDHECRHINLSETLKRIDDKLDILIESKGKLEVTVSNNSFQIRTIWVILFTAIGNIARKIML